MSYNLAIVESPAKAKKIQGYLGSGWRVIASMGHVRDLPPKAIGVDVANEFAPTYEISAGKQKVVSQLRAAAKEASAIYLATDPDREGEAIAWHVAEALGRIPKNKPVYRVTFGEITPRAIKAAFAQPRQLDMALVDSQQARRVLDRLVGWKVSPILRMIFGTSLSAGRVQSVAVRLVVEREQVIETFVPEQYWTLEGLFVRQRPAFEQFGARLSALLALQDKELEAGRLPTVRVHAIAEELSQSAVIWRVQSVETKEQKQSPPPPFVTSTLQQKASSLLKLKPRMAMQVAQSLYEQGLITYMRTDSPGVAQEAQAKAREVITGVFGADSLPPHPPHYRAKGNAQEAHECIRPTDSGLLPKNAALSGHAAGLYRLIWMRFIASQMKPALYDVTIALIEPSLNAHPLPYLFTARGRVLRTAGWLAVYGFQPGLHEKEEEDEDEDNQALPPLKADEPLTCRELAPKEHWTQPPDRYTEPSLIKALEKEGVGRPSTYASIMETIQERGYVEGKAKSLTPTPAGRAVTGFLTEHFPDLLNIGFTRQMESDLDRVAEGEIQWSHLIADFYQPLAQKIATARTLPQQPSLATPCPKCGVAMQEQYGTKGKYLICTHCGYNPTAPRPTHLTCPKCDQPLVQRKGKKGLFLGCSGYPTCTFTENLEPQKPKRTPRRAASAKRKEAGTKGGATAKAQGATAAATPPPSEAIGQPCPDCGKPLVERKSKYGTFVGCSGYPACKHIVR